MAHVLITGASGFVGASVTKALSKRGDQVTAFDIAVSPALATIAEETKNIRIVTGDITVSSAVVELFEVARPDCVFHAAAMVGVIATVQAPIRTFEVNVLGTINLLEAMHRFGTKRMVHMSSEETYGHFQNSVIDENHPQNPIHPYGISKLAVEHLGRSYKASYQLEVIHLRAIWIYGPGLPRDRVPNSFIKAALEGRSFRQPFGANFVCDHTYIDDVTDAAILAIDKTKHPYDVYNIGSGQGVSLQEITNIVVEIVPDAQLSIGNAPYRHGNEDFSVECVKKGALDIARARAILGYSPKFDIRRGLESFCVSVLAEHPT